MDKHIETLVQRYSQLESCKDDILKAYQILEEAYSAGRKLLVAGNGGSASDSEHIVGELMKEFKLKRKIYAAQIDRLMQIDAEMGTVFLKNCHNIGSENAAENTAFVFSLTESCRLNGINPETYLEKLFKCIVSKETYDKRQLLPCYIKI